MNYLDPRKNERVSIPDVQTNLISGLKQLLVWVDYEMQVGSGNWANSSLIWSTWRWTRNAI